MKKILMIAASLAMVAGLASCQKENVANNGSNAEDTKTGTITATFANPTTKVTYNELNAEGDLFDLQPKWEVNDTIVGISPDNKVFELKVISINSGVATLEENREAVPEGAVTLFYKKGLKMEDWDSEKKQFVVSLNGQKGDNTMPAIMMATGTIDNGNAQFEFDNSGAVLGIYEVGDGLKSKSIKQVTLYGKNLASSATLDKTNGVKFTTPTGTFNVISTGILSGINVGEDGKVKQNSEDKPILMAVPAEAVVDSVFIRTTDGEVYSLGSSNKVAMAANDYRYIKDATFVRDAKRDGMILTGVYSVDANKQVFFSKGNLWYGKVGVAETETFNFEANQYDSTPSDDGEWSTDHISHFYWSKDPNEAIKEYYDSGQTVSDKDVFFTNETDFTVNVGETKQSGWRTLSTAEWQYLINKDNDENVRKGKYKYGVEVCEKANCLVLAPDDFIGTIEASYNATAWASAEAAGLVCLPAAGSRSDSDVSYVGDYGYYWASSANGSEEAYCVNFISYNVSPGNIRSRYYGYSVRLITECQ